MEQKVKQVIMWKPKRSEKKTPKNGVVPDEYVGKLRTKVPEGTPGAVRNFGENKAGKKWDFWELEVDSVAGQLRWIDKRDGGDYGTSLLLFLESDKYLHQIDIEYDGFSLKDVMNYLCGLGKDITTAYLNVSYWVRKQTDRDGKVKTDKDGKPIWRKSISFRDIQPQFSFDEWMSFAEANGLKGEHKRKADGTKEWVDDAAIKYWDSRLVAMQRYLLTTDAVLPFCYNSFTACEAPNPSGGGNLTAEEIATCNSIYEAVKPLYRFSYQRSAVDADSAMDALESMPQQSAPLPSVQGVKTTPLPSDDFPQFEVALSHEDSTPGDFDTLPF